MKLNHSTPAFIVAFHQCFITGSLSVIRVEMRDYSGCVFSCIETPGSYPFTSYCMPGKVIVCCAEKKAILYVCHYVR